MNSTKQCRRVVLAGSEGCQVVYCPDCEIAELEIGAMNIRLEESVFRTVVSMLNSATKTLEGMQGVLAGYPQMLGGGRVH
jgi:asparagine synthetase A